MTDEGVAGRSSPSRDPSLLDEEWKGYGGEDTLDDLSVIADFNASFDQGSQYRLYVDPQLLSRPSTSDSKQSALLIESDLIDNSAHTTQSGRVFVPVPASAQEDFNSSHGAFHQSTTQLASDTIGTHLVYPTVTDQVPPTPYLHSIDHFSDDMLTQPPPSYAPSPLRHQLSRRSVSEPPAGPPSDISPGHTVHHHYLPPPGAQAKMIFHRQGHYLGKPLAESTAAERGRSPVRSSNRYQPYPKDKRAIQERPGRQTHVSRRERARTQPACIPTSTPPSQMGSPLVVGLSGLPRHSGVAPHAEILQLEHVGARHCTPLVEGVLRQSPQQVWSERNGVERTTLSINVSVEHLQRLITEAVSNAMRGMERDSSFHEGHPGLGKRMANDEQ